MNRQDFTGYIQRPSSLHPGLKDDFRDLADRYSYCSSIQVLYTFLLHSASDHEVNFQLRKAAAYTTSRKKLKELMETIPIRETAALIPGPEEPLIRQPADHDEPRENPRTSAEEELMERVKKRLAEIEAEKHPYVLEEKPEVEAPIIKQTSDLRSDFLSKEEIIEKFIREEPRISQPRAAFFRPSEYATRSNIDDTDIVSETLARLYLEQGNIIKARMIYNKLSLLFPEKSSYFAAQIEKTDK